MKNIYNLTWILNSQILKFIFSLFLFFLQIIMKRRYSSDSESLTEATNVCKIHDYYRQPVGSTGIETRDKSNLKTNNSVDYKKNQRKQQFTKAFIR